MKNRFSFSRPSAVVKFCVSKASLPEREKQICRRVRAARELRGKTQHQCAELTGIERSTLANYEAEITPLGFDQAKRICYRLNINQWWLATGESPFKPYFDLGPHLEFSIKPNALYSAAFDTVLKTPILEQIEALISLIGAKAYLSGKYDEAVLENLHQVGDDPGKAAAFYVNKVLKLKFNWMPEAFRPQFAAALTRAEKSFWKKHGAEIEKQIRERQSQEIADQAKLEAVKAFLTKDSMLTEAESHAKTLDVPKQMPELLERLRKAAQAPGKKSELAVFLRAPLASVSRWLSGEREPGGEIALQMDAWATEQGYPKRPSNKK